MKKLLVGLLVFLGAFNFTYASSGELVTNTGAINAYLENTSYTYFYGQGCPHCAKVDSYLTKVDGYEKINIEKKEIYFDDENREEMLEAGKRLGINESEIGVPFLVISEGETEYYLIGDGPIIEYFKQFLGEAPENNNKYIVLVVLAILAILIPVFLIKMTNKN